MTGYPGLRRSDTENEQVVTLVPHGHLDVERGLDVSQGLLVIVDGGKGLRPPCAKPFRHRRPGRCNGVSDKRENFRPFARGQA